MFHTDILENPKGRFYVGHTDDPERLQKFGRGCSLDIDGHLSDSFPMVSFITTRDLSKKPGQVMSKVSEEGPQVITQNGVPAAYLVPTSGRGIEADLDSLRRLLLTRALDAAQAEAARSGTASLGMGDINEAIAATRKERRGSHSAE